VRRRRQKENQEDLLQRVNQATLDMLNKGGAGGNGGGGQGRKITDIVAYKNVADMQHNNTLTVQVDHRSECVLAPIYGVLVPFHILTIKNASNNQVGGGAARRRQGGAELMGAVAVLALGHAKLRSHRCCCLSISPAACPRLALPAYCRMASTPTFG
jgi:hypothetical protein